MKALSIRILLSFSLWLGVCVGPSHAAEAFTDWQTVTDPSSSLALQYPQNWSSSIDSKTGRIDLVSQSGAALSILPFSVAGQTIETLGAKTFFSTLIKMFAPNEIWSDPIMVGKSGYHSTYSNTAGNGSAALVVQPTDNGIEGLVCAAKIPKGVTDVTSETFANIMSTVRPKKTQIDDGSPAQNNQGSESNESEETAEVGQNIVSGWTKFRDPSEGSFTVDVPEGWTVTGGLTRYGALDVRPWVKATSPDQLITAFIGDGKISPCTMPTATLSALGFHVGSKSNGTLIQPYIPARQFAEKYAKMNLGSFLSNLQVVEEQNHPEIAAAVNGTTGATKSEAATIKLTGMYGQIPAVAYYLAVTKATVAYGTGMWWVTKVAGSVGPAARDAETLGVILHMLGSFEVDQAWASNSLRNTVAVSQHYRRVSQQVSQSITNRYWSQQAHNDKMNQAYWNRQASQDRAANNFSNYIRGVENVQDPDTGAKYQVQYGPQGHYVDSGSNYIYSGDNAPGPEWRQLLSVP